MHNLNLLKIFIKVAQLGSYTKAAQNYNWPKSRVSRSISRLEDELGIQLIRRTTRQVTLTSSGRQLYQKTQLLFAQIDEEINSLQESKNEIAGDLRVTAPEDIAQSILANIIESFVIRYPKIKVETIITNDFLDLTKENIDIAFRIGRRPDSTMIQRKIGDVQIILVASPEYLKNNGHPKILPDLQGHGLLLFKRIKLEDLIPIKGDSSTVQATLESDSFPLLLNLCLRGNGIATLPEVFCKQHLQEGKLIRIFPQWQSKKSTIHLVYPPSKNMPLRSRIFIDSVIENVQNLL